MGPDLTTRPLRRPDDFFQSLRALYNERSQDNRLSRLVFCLAGVATVSELVHDPTRSPFNVGKTIELGDFTREQMGAFAPGLSMEQPRLGQVLDTVYGYTSGHPAMTHKLCELLAEDPMFPAPEARVRELVQRTYLGQGDGPMHDLLKLIEGQFLKRFPEERERMIDRYRSLLLDEVVELQPKDTTHAALLLTGIVGWRQEGERRLLCPRNQVVSEAFGLDWISRQRDLRGLEPDLSLWLEHDRHRDYLLRGRRLAAAQTWSADRDLLRNEGAFLIASKDAQRRRLWIQFGFFLGVLGLLFLSVGLSYRSYALMLERDVGPAITAAEANLSQARQHLQSMLEQSEGRLDELMDERRRMLEEMHARTQTPALRVLRRKQLLEQLTWLDSRLSLLHAETEAEKEGLKTQRQQVAMTQRRLEQTQRKLDQVKLLAANPLSVRLYATEEVKKRLEAAEIEVQAVQGQLKKDEEALEARTEAFGNRIKELRRQAEPVQQQARVQDRRQATERQLAPELRGAWDLYVEGQYETAIRSAQRQAAKTSQAYRLIGLAACYLKDEALAERAWRKTDGDGRSAIMYACRDRNGVLLKGLPQPNPDEKTRPQTEDGQPEQEPSGAALPRIKQPLRDPDYDEHRDATEAPVTSPRTDRPRPSS